MTSIIKNWVKVYKYEELCKIINMYKFMPYVFKLFGSLNNDYSANKNIYVRVIYYL